MTDIKSFDPAVIASITTGTLLTDFSLMHEAAEHVMGHPIWTHQFPVLAEALKNNCLEQFPEMPTEISTDGWEKTRDEVREKFGDTINVKKGSEKGINPLDPKGFPDVMKKKMGLN